MPYRRIFFEKNQPVHIVSRAVEGIKIFSQDENAYRFIFQFYAANLGRRSPSLENKDMVKIGKYLLAGEKIPSKSIIEEHPPFVFVLDFALAVNHYHFYLLPNIENSIPLLLQKTNNGFAKYFNLKHDRKDALFGARYKSVLVKTEFQSDAISRYISIINPLDVYQPGWREEGLKDLDGAFEFLKSYQFSSFPDKIGQRKSLILAPSEIQGKYFPHFLNKEIYQESVKNFLEQKLDSFQPFFLE
jgi:hypothetical protein